MSTTIDSGQAGAMVVALPEEASPAARSRPFAKRHRELWTALSAFKREFIIVGLLSAVSNLLMLTPTLYMLQVYDRVMMSQNELTLAAVSLIALLMFGTMALAEWGRSRLLVS